MYEVRDNGNKFKINGKGLKNCLLLWGGEGEEEMGEKANLAEESVYKDRTLLYVFLFLRFLVATSALKTVHHSAC